MRVFVFSIFFIIINYNLSYSATFKNFTELNKCIKSYSSYVDYKNKIQKCFLDQNIKINDEGINLIKNKNGIINDIIELNLPNNETIKKKKGFKQIMKDFLNPDLEKMAQEESLFNKPTVFSENYNEAKNFTLNNKDFKKLNTHIKNNPQDLYALTEDINYLSKWTEYMSEFKRQELLLNIYNSFDPLILNSYIKPKNVSNIGFDGSQVGIIAAVGVAALAGGGGGSGSSSSSSSPATLSFSVSASSLGECDTGITITGNLTKAHSSNVNITYSTGGTATSGTDYNLSSSSSTIVSRFSHKK